MMGQRSVQQDLWEVPSRVADRIESDSIFRILHDLRPVLLRDEDFEHLYSSTGRPSHAPSLLMGVLLLKEATDVSDREAIDFPGFPPANLVHFRVRMVVDSIDEWIFQRVNELAIELGLLDPKGEQAIDSSHIFGAGAVQDTYELIRSAMRDLLQTLESIDEEAAEGLIRRHELEKAYLAEENVETRYVEPGAPWENGYIEAFNSRFRDELLDRELFATTLEAQVLCEQWRRFYNEERPHSALDYQTPAAYTANYEAPQPSSPVPILS